MRNLSNGRDNWCKILCNFDVVSFIEGPISLKQLENSDGNEFPFCSTLQIRLINFRFSHDSNQENGY